MARVFISHSTHDREFVEREIIAPLRARGIETWYSRDSILTTENWERSILGGLKACDWFLVVMSPASQKSEWVKDEVNWAIDERAGRVIPVLIGKVDPSDFHIRIRRIQHVDFVNEPAERARTKLLSVFPQQVAKPPPPPPPPEIKPPRTRAVVREPIDVIFEPAASPDSAAAAGTAGTAAPANVPTKTVTISVSKTLPTESSEVAPPTAELGFNWSRLARVAVITLDLMLAGAAGLLFLAGLVASESGGPLLLISLLTGLAFLGAAATMVFVRQPWWVSVSAHFAALATPFVVLVIEAITMPMNRGGNPPLRPMSYITPDVPTITVSHGIELALVQSGPFQMGSPSDETGRDIDEEAAQIILTQPFYLGIHEVTQAQYEAVMGKNPSHFARSGKGRSSVTGTTTDQFPVENVSWEEATEFCEKLSALSAEQSAGRVYRLPTEAEWEYACRAGTTTPFHFGKELTSDLANFDGTLPYGTTKTGRHLLRTATCGSYPPNAFGLFDMHGNVREWCHDWYADDYGRQDSQIDPHGPILATSGRVVRGGDWQGGAVDCRSARRNYSHPGTTRSLNIGFRIACDATSAGSVFPETAPDLR